MKKYVISENILSATIQYLETRPFAEVARLHSAINTDVKELEEYKAEEITKKEETEKQNAELKETVKNKIINEYLAEQEKIVEADSIYAQ